VAVFAFAPPWLSARFSQHVLDGSSSPASDLRWARRLDPLSVQPYLVQAAVARTPAEAIPPLQTAARKQPRSVEVRFELAQAYVRAKRRREGLRELRAALRLEPGAPAIEQALGRLEDR
jgi:cytochrome c-type biogenesis protein CcmH/NrfG